MVITNGTQYKCTGRTIIHGKHGLFWSPGPSTRGPVVARRARYTVATTDKRRGPLYSVSGIWYTVVCFELKPAVCVLASERGSKAEYGWASRQSPCVDLLSRECPARTKAPASSTSMFACLRKCACFCVCAFVPVCLYVGLCVCLCVCLCMYLCGPFVRECPAYGTTTNMAQGIHAIQQEVDSVLISQKCKASTDVNWFFRPFCRSEERQFWSINESQKNFT